jgi:hypothetical protein
VNRDHNIKSHLHVKNIPKAANFGEAVHPPLDNGLDLWAWLRVTRHTVIVAFLPQRRARGLARRWVLLETLWIWERSDGMGKLPFIPKTGGCSSASSENSG